MFPFQLLQWGPLYPNTLAYSLLPLALLILVGLFRAGRERFLDDVSLWFFLAIAVAALFLSQPNGVTALLAFSVPLIAAAWFSQMRARIRSTAGNRAIGLTVLWGLAAAPAFLIVWQALLLNFDSRRPAGPWSRPRGYVGTTPRRRRQMVASVGPWSTSSPSSGGGEAAGLLPAHSLPLPSTSSPSSCILGPSGISRSAAGTRSVPFLLAALCRCS